MEIRQQLTQLFEEAQVRIAGVRDPQALEEFRIAYLGKKGAMTSVMRGLGQLSAEERPLAGQLANDCRRQLEEAFAAKLDSFRSQAAEGRLERETIDITLPGRPQNVGGLHPLTLMQRYIEDIFIGMGFSIAEGPEIELDYYNFEALNIPKNHPARDTQDTFYVVNDILLRTHTSPTQVRTMQERKPPLRIIVPGRVYRVDELDATHSPVFHQVEGLVVDEGVTMADLKGTLDAVAKAIFGPDTRTRFRPHHFQFTEPSAEMDISCTICHGAGCRTCGHTGWIELLGAGMVHPNVLRHGGVDPERYSGFAFGMGLDRFTDMRYGISDIRMLFDSNLMFLKQF